MRTQPYTAGVSRRSVLKTMGATLIVAGVTPAGVILGRNETWAATPEVLAPDTFATLVQMTRDIYPHERLEDKYYAVVVSGLDSAANSDEGLKTMLDTGVAMLDESAGSSYRSLEGEEDRVAILEKISSSDFFQKMRGSLVTGLYNNKEAWPLFGYEGESFSKGGYINRGFDDID